MEEPKDFICIVLVQFESVLHGGNVQIWKSKIPMVQHIKKIIQSGIHFVLKTHQT